MSVLRMERPWLKPLFVLGLVIFLLLGGCVRYEVGIDFNEQHQGQILQHIQLSEQLTNLSQTEATNWLKSIETRAQALGGKTKRLSPRELEVKIPFGNGQELSDRFNQFFNPDESKALAFTPLDNPELVQLKAELSLQQSNWLFAERDRLRLSVDLRALGILSNQGNIILSPGSLLDLTFVLNTPWGATTLATEGDSAPHFLASSHPLIWQLQPGQINTIETIFWVPSYLAIGVLGVILLMIAGYWLKYRELPGVPHSSKPA
jgi:hypothetical protein